MLRHSWKNVLRFLTCIAALTVLLAASVHARDIVVVQSMHVPPYEDALKGFRSGCSASMSGIVLSELQGRDPVKLIREQHPKMILAIGSDALTAVKRITDIPVVYMMVLNPRVITQGSPNITGVSMNIPPEKEFQFFRKVLPHRYKRIGVVYNPARTGDYVRQAMRAAKSYGFDIVASEARSPKEVPELVSTLAGRIDAYWMIPDQALMTPDTVEHLLLFSIDTMVPVLTFAPKYVEMGALLSVNFDAADLGRQAGDLARKVLEGTEVGDIPQVDARHCRLMRNPIVEKKLGVNRK